MDTAHFSIQLKLRNRNRETTYADEHEERDFTFVLLFCLILNETTPVVQAACRSV